MAYTDGLYFVEGALTAGSSTAAVVKIRGDAASEKIILPGGATIEEFGAITTEAWNVDTLPCILALKQLHVYGGTAVTLGTITFPKTAGAAASAVGVRSVNPSVRGTRVLPGEVLYFEVTQAATDTTKDGSFIPYLILRLDGAKGANSAAPVVEYAA